MATRPRNTPANGVKPQGQEIFEHLIDWSISRLAVAKKVKDAPQKRAVLAGAMRLLTAAGCVLKEADTFKWVQE